MNLKTRLPFWKSEFDEKAVQPLAGSGTFPTPTATSLIQNQTVLWYFRPSVSIRKSRRVGRLPEFDWRA